jgi:hypothetical protein
VIIYTPLPIDVVLSGFEQHRDWREIDLDGVTAVVEPAGQDRGRIVKIISTDPNDFMNPRYAPGTEVVFRPLIDR